MLVGFAFTVLVAVAGYVGIPKGFFPLQDTAFVFGTSQAAEDISYDDMVAKHRQLAEIIASDPAVQSYNHAVGVTGGSQSLANGRFWIVLKDRGERDVSVGEFIDRLRPQLAKVPGIMLYLRAAQDINLSSGPSRTQYQYALRSSDSTQLALWAQRLTERLKPRRVSASAPRMSARPSTTPSASARSASTRPRSTSTRWSSNSMRASAAARKAWTGSTCARR